MLCQKHLEFNMDHGGSSSGWSPTPTAWTTNGRKTTVWADGLIYLPIRQMALLFLSIYPCTKQNIFDTKVIYLSIWFYLYTY